MAHGIPRDKNGVMGLLLYPEQIDLLRVVEAEDVKRILIGLADYQWNSADRPKVETEFAKAIIPTLFNMIDVRLQKSKAGKSKGKCDDSSDDSHIHTHTHIQHTINSVCEERAGAHTHAREKKRFEKPTVEEINEYCKAKGFYIDAQEFIDHYDSCGWVIGRDKPMKDWRAAVNRWHRKDVKDGKEYKPPSVTKAEDTRTPEEKTIEDIPPAVRHLYSSYAEYWAAKNQ